MARAISLQNMVGSFVEKDHGKTFDYKLNRDVVLYPIKNYTTVFPHLIFVGPNGDETRMALVKKTIAYVVIDEGVIEKWQIKKHVKYS